jgi:predicted TIM-barrel fold metal-dependent hydrolase
VSELPIVDAHHHIWDIGRNYHPWLRDEPMIPFRYGSYASLRRNYLATDYRADTSRFDIRATVYVEAEWDPGDPIGETRWVHEIAAREGLPNAVVAQAWLDREDVAEVLAKQAAFSLVRSVRHKPRAARSASQARRGEPGSMDCAIWRAGFARLERHGLHFDLQTPWWHLEAAAALARDFPRTLIIINHTGLPSDRSPDGIAAWRSALELMAREPNTRLKISGLGVPGKGWTVALNGPVVRDAISIFGATRSMFASNFPVDSLVATFGEIFDGFDAMTANLEAADRRWLFHDTAIEVYRPAMPSRQ